MTSIGTAHFVLPDAFESIVPGWVPNPRFWVFASGVAEIASGVLVALPRTRRVGGWLGAATIVGVYPANIQMALDAGRPDSVGDAAVWLRLPLQFPMLAWALRHARGRRWNAPSPSGGYASISRA
ncbi:MAG: hypothetical protein JO291_15790 [Acidimicrobiia bacterium]|nr:hypothetical protein [Acidimicrobiia bacterium]